MRVEAPAKVNLFLEVLGRRPDGYHAVETLMLKVALRDALDLGPAPDGVTEIVCDRPGVPTGPDNLVAKAADALRRRTGRRDGVRAELTKRVPAAAGLAGGSSDAAAALAGLNDLWGLGLPAAELAACAAEVGSDVAFFLGGPAAWCTGRGEVVEPEAVGAEFEFVLVCPPAGLSTAAVYREVRVPAEPVSGDAARAALRAGDADALGRALFNRLWEPAARLEPQVARWGEHLAAAKPAGWSMSGSGSSLFALCRDGAEAGRVERELLGAAARATERDRPRVVRVRGYA